MAADGAVAAPLRKEACYAQAMHGLLSGAILGIAFIAFAGAARSWRNWKQSDEGARPPRILMVLSLLLQVLLGALAAAFGLWFALAGAP
ncbi:hypothetical protein EDM80_12145 [bacterium]|nr:MAG: hypothetical protein EDM80_12145 [bacterium]RIK64588.1 MAG: hypothetical protein DCC64_03150 [Planctomycetota bacterium]